ncbi:hypothetical protein AVDCRST_MAG94-4664 [uncultured Leptolyngbya sp.]|uniref:Uncharacterized protein n=1 Tax=uncultured Leptolyngbya sp. TaxID=332963 RepID=A0A6J4N843_9CYAN|nr:hypothetical protein AVDCRST_MAG94-4664 [uncultured Leptolyngbya sp.]
MGDCSAEFNAAATTKPRRAKKNPIALTGLVLSLLVLRCPLISVANDHLVLLVLDSLKTGTIAKSLIQQQFFFLSRLPVC